MSLRATEPTITLVVTTVIRQSSLILKTSSLLFSHNTKNAFVLNIPFTNLQNSMPQFFSSVASFSTVFKLFDKIPRKAQIFRNPSYFDFIDLAKFSSINPNKKNTKIVHCLVVKAGVFAHLPTSTSLLVTYSRAGEFGSSIKLFDDIKYKDVVVWNAMMTICIENMNFGSAMDLFLEMRGEGESFDSGTLVITMSGVTNTKNLKQGRFLHGLSLKSGMLLDLYLSNAIIDLYAKCGDLGSSVNMFESIEFKDRVSWNSIITGCLRNKSPQNSLLYFKKMLSVGIHDDVSLSCAIASSTCLRDLNIGEAIHGCGIKLGYVENSCISVDNAIISFYGECGQPESAEIVFKGIVCKDVVSWNSMVNGFALNGMVFEAFDIIYEMQTQKLVQPDSVTIVTIVPLCAEFNFFREGRSVHAYIIRQSMCSHSLIINSLMDFYLKCGHVRAAEYIFNAKTNRDLVSWNTIISGYSQLRYYREAQSLFKELTFWCSECSLSTILAILPSCCSPESLMFGKTLHSWQLKLGFPNNTPAINALMFMYINCGDLNAANTILGSFYDVADTVSWNTLITGCSQNGYSRKALETFNLMRKYNANHDRITLSNVISACGDLGLVIEGKSFHGLSFKSVESTDIHVQNYLITMYGELGDTKSANLVFSCIRNKNLCSWNCIISAFSHNKEGKRALEMFQFLDIEPNEITISSVLSACTQLGFLRHGRQIHAYTYRFNFHTNPYISAALIDMYSNCGRLDNGLQVFQYLPNKSVSAWNSVISAYGYHNNSEKTIETFNEMIDYGMMPTKSTFINLLSACSHLGLVDEGKWHFDNMLNKFGVQPETEHHVCMVDILGRSGKLGEAHEFVEKLPSPPQPGVWGALLSACGYYGDIEMGKEVAEILFKLEPDNAGYYVLLFNMYVGAGRWDDAAKLRRKFEDKGLKKRVGVSLIDVSYGCERLMHLQEYQYSFRPH